MAAPPISLTAHLAKELKVCLSTHGSNIYNLIRNGIVTHVTSVDANLLSLEEIYTENITDRSSFRHEDFDHRTGSCGDDLELVKRIFLLEGFTVEIKRSKISGMSYSVTVLVKIR